MTDTQLNGAGELIEELEPVEIDVTVTLDESEVVKLYKLKQEFPEEILKQAWRVAVKEQLDNQYDNREQIKDQLVQQGVIEPDESAHEPGES